ncbi:hypothetical protein ES703_64176 [subsurface metagenome]
MEVIKNLLIRFRQSAVLVLIGFFLIIYIAFGFLYFQQSSQQKELEEQSANMSLILIKPLPSEEELQAEYDEVNLSLAPMTDSDAIAIIVDIAEKSGIDIDPDSDKLRVPSAKSREEKVGGGTYQVFSFMNISVQGDYDKVMAFISDLDSGEMQETMVLKRVNIRQIEVQVVSEEGSEEPKVESKIETVATLDVDLYTKL